VTDEEKHCAEVADTIIFYDRGDTNTGKWRKRVADLIAKERADLLARVVELERINEDLRNRCADDETWREQRDAAVARAERAEAALKTERYEHRHTIEQRDRRHAELDELRAKLAASEARATDFEARLAINNAASTEIRRAFEENRRTCSEALSRAERAEAAAAQMRASIDYLREVVNATAVVMDADLLEGAYDRLFLVAPSDVGKGWLSPEGVAAARAEARREALELAAAKCDKNAERCRNYRDNHPVSVQHAREQQIAAERDASDIRALVKEQS